MVVEFTTTSVDEPLLVAALVLLLAIVHLAPPEVLQSVKVPGPILLSISGGISIAYVFLRLFPELDAHRTTIDGIDLWVVTLQDHHIYGIVFIGVALYYGFERLATVASEDIRGPAPETAIFWAHLSGFAVYNMLIGYALIHGEIGAHHRVLFTIAMAFHLFGNDAALEEHHQTMYDTLGRWVLMAAVIFGATLGVVFTLAAPTFTVLLGLLTGGIVFNAIKDELPQTRTGRFWAFLAGAVGYAIILTVTAPPM